MIGERLVGVVVMPVLAALRRSVVIATAFTRRALRLLVDHYDRMGEPGKGITCRSRLHGG